jgi:hypothetical protein
MAWRINQSIVQGEIDNREKGHVRAFISLIGRDEPIALKLSGNCRADLAGCRISFTNPKAMTAPDERTDLNRAQTGVVGDITASRKVRVLDVPLEDASRIAKEGGSPPEHIANALYFEWFSEENGRVVIESVAYKIDVSPPMWMLSPQEEEQQIAATQQAMRDWLDHLDEELETARESNFDPDDDEPLDEFGHEKLMRESDARTDKYMKLLEKYEGHPDQKKIVAREMGWTWLEEALEADERGALPPSENMEVPELEPNPLTEGVDWIRDEDGHIHHPLAKRAFDSAIKMWHYCKERALLEENGDDDLAEMVFQFQTTAAKLAGALNSLAYHEDHTDYAGFVVATLKRTLKYLHASIAATEKVTEKKLIDPDQLQSFRSGLFEVREEILALMQRFRSLP